MKKRVKPIAKKRTSLIKPKMHGTAKNLKRRRKANRG